MRQFHIFDGVSTMGVWLQKREFSIDFPRCVALAFRRAQMSAVWDEL